MTFDKQAYLDRIQKAVSDGAKNARKRAADKSQFRANAARKRFQKHHGKP